MIKAIFNAPLDGGDYLLAIVWGASFTFFTGGGPFSVVLCQLLAVGTFKAIKVWIDRRFEKTEKC